MSGRGGIEYTFQHITIKGEGREESGEERLILDRCSGFIEAGTLTGILGPSGCGKSTLVSTLLSPPSSLFSRGGGRVEARVQRGEGRGERGVPVSTPYLRKQVGYVPQVTSCIRLGRRRKKREEREEREERRGQKEERGEERKNTKLILQPLHRLS